MSTIDEKVQSYLTDRLDQGLRVTTAEVQEYVYGPTYRFDSHSQHDAIYNAIRIGRERAWQLWRNYCQNPRFKADCANVEYYKANEVDAQLGTSDFGEWWVEVHKPGSFGKLTSDMKKYFYHLAHVAVLWDEKLRDFATNGMNLVVASYGRQAFWGRPTYWGFSLRERNLDVRFCQILIRKMKEGWEGELTLPDARPYPKMIGYAESVSAMLSDGSNWVCTCGMINAQKQTTCVHCGKPKPF